MRVYISKNSEKADDVDNVQRIPKVALFPMEEKSMIMNCRMRSLFGEKREITSIVEKRKRSS